ncbi:MAG: hypothetical protein KatS3mg050_3514 [Litorilinea sp.]|nr:MAG: hypothetical protein KatS3mg050_3514 [Litorilinea sp.]
MEWTKDVRVDKLVVACIQQRMRLPWSLEQYQEDLRRFLRVATAKRARLIVFPELAGLMVAPPLLADFKSSLLKRADQGRSRSATPWQRLSGAAARTLARLLHADLRASLAALLDVSAPAVWQAYQEVFAGLAREFGVVLVAPSAYLPDPQDGVLRNLAAVFGSNGELLGTQAKVVLHPDDVDMAQAGQSWNVIPTEVGQLGLILGSDVLYPEVGRLLAYQGAEILAVLAACPEPALYNKIRTGILARMQDNQLFAVASFLVGHNEIGRTGKSFVGKSAIFAPQELTPRLNGVLVEMGNYRSEGVLTAEWDFPALRALWESSDTPVRRQLPLGQTGKILAQLYGRLQGLPNVMEPATLRTLEVNETPTLPASAGSEEVHSLDDLPVISSITSRWPPPSTASPRRGSQAETTDDPLPDDPLPVEEVEDGSWVLPPSPAASTPPPPPVSSEDETDEMDALS